MEMKPVRPIRDRYALHGGALWFDGNSTAKVELTVSQARGLDVVLHALVMQTDVGSDEPLSELVGEISHVLDLRVMEALCGLPVSDLVREFPSVSAILEGR